MSTATVTFQPGVARLDWRPGESAVAAFAAAKALVDPIIITGPVGPMGLPGNAGAYFEVEYIAPANGAQSIPITYPPTAFQFLTINGLQQSASDYTIVGTTLNLAAGLGIVAGDKIYFTFSRS